MTEEVRLTLQVVVSAIFIFVVLVGVWRIPGAAVLDSALAPVLAFSSVWVGLASVVVGGYLWFAGNADAWVFVHVLVWAAAITLGSLALWIYRHTPAEQMTEPIQMQRGQARVGLFFGVMAVVLWYIFVITHAGAVTPGG